MKIKKFLKSMVLFLALASFVLILKMKFEMPAFAQGLTDTLKDIEMETSLPTFETNSHAKASIQSGASNITSAIYYLIDYAKLLLGTVAVVMVIITGIKLIIARKQIDEVKSAQKEHLIMITAGIIVIFIVDVLVQKVFFGAEGEVWESQAQAQMAAEEGYKEMRGMYSLVMMISGVIAVLMLIIAGYRLIVSAGNEEVQGKIKNQITALVIGLLLLGVAEFVIKDIVFPDHGATIPSAEKAKYLLVNFTNFISGFVSIGALLSSIYGGYLYVAAFGNEEQTGKAKNVIMGAMIALILAVGAFAVVNTFVQFEPYT